MREIKFRAWVGKMIEVGSMEFFTNGTIHVDNNLDTFPIGDKTYGKENALMQFTGVKDKNGKDIYEGDIIRQIFSRGKLEIGEVTIDPARGVLVGRRYPLWCHNAEVIGNIYENLELLAGQ